VDVATIDRWKGDDELEEVIRSGRSNGSGNGAAKPVDGSSIDKGTEGRGTIVAKSL
jgi:hypothetical protein